MRLWIDQYDRWVLSRISAWRPPLWVRGWMIGASRLGDGWLWWALGFGILIWGGRHRYQVGVAGGVAAGAAQGVSRLLKITVARSRPAAAFRTWARLRPPDPYSFPSAHTMTGVAFATSAGYAYPALSGPMWFAAASIGVSRVALGLHYPSDVVAGAVAGWAIGYATHMLL